MLLYLLLSCYLQFHQVPVLCYHNIGTAGEDALHISKQHFYEQLQYFYDNGYVTITPDELYAHMNRGAPLPSKAMMITFDDSHAEHYTIAVPVLNKFHFKGVFFIMTVCLNKPGWLTTDEVKDMASQGHIIACHTWDHPNLALHPTYSIDQQLIKPKKYLEKITGAAIRYFAYPYGAWSEQVVKDLKQVGFIAAFQLDSHQQSADTNFTIRRILVAGKWTGSQLKEVMNKAFNLPITTIPSQNGNY
ncbi:polysaccharide deacetylase family protein [Chitinophaga sp.]|uniref:polysaccharide deacetylase family protein n=1 Tax=Chitinophaga sp. TaxID=1869181 RepID=UPI0031D3EE1B